MRYCRAARWLLTGRLALVCLREPDHPGWHHDDRMGVWWPP